MAAASAARCVACDVLGEVRRREARARDVLRGSPRVDMLDVRDRGQATRLVLGVTGALGLLDELINARLSGRARLEPKVRDAMRVAVYDILFLGTPTNVGVSQGVELVRRARPRAAGLANAVLRRIAQEDVPAREAALARCEAAARGELVVQDNSYECDISSLALVSGYPAWLLERMDCPVEVALSATGPAPVYVAANRALHDNDETLELLEAAGLQPESCDVPGSFVLGSAAGLARSGLVEGSDLVVADLSAQRIAAMIPVEAGAHVLEVGQGRGTKSILLASRAIRASESSTKGGKGGVGSPEERALRGMHILGVDSMEFKTRVATNRMARAGLSNVVTCVTLDACELASNTAPEAVRQAFDVVFVDAPCSGTGTLRRHPEICWNLKPQDIISLASLQLEILMAAATRVRAGGMLCYATCSLMHEENDAVVESFLESEPGARFVLEGKPLRTTPALGGPDGHFLAMLRHI